MLPMLLFLLNIFFVVVISFTETSDLTNRIHLTAVRFFDCIVSLSLAVRRLQVVTGVSSLVQALLEEAEKHVFYNKMQVVGI